MPRAGGIRISFAQWGVRPFPAVPFRPSRLGCPLASVGSEMPVCWNTLFLLPQHYTTPSEKTQ